MIVGLDFDNTIVCYDQAILKLSQSIPDLPSSVRRTKLGLRDHLRSMGRETEWTAFQGTLYGPGMEHAEPFEGALETMLQMVADGHRLVIISHRSRHPYAGPPYDLHAAARSWVARRLQSLGLFSSTLDHANAVNFLETRERKIAKISELKCDVFLDDLPEVLNDEHFPSRTMPLLFDPTREHVAKANTYLLNDWQHLPKILADLT
jgi:hypothetical protein